LAAALHDGIAQVAALVLAGERRIERPIDKRLNQIESILRAENFDRGRHCPLKDCGNGGDLDGALMARFATRTAVRYEFSQTGAKAASSQAAFIVSSFRSLGISTPLI
jgi:hypothetical protein